jgi:hypothetical protein
MDLNVPIRLSGRAVAPIVAAEVRELQPTDFALLATERGIEPAPLKRLGERHHALARLLAQGTSPGEAALITGLSNSRVSILKADPTFQNLVELYRGEVTEAYRGMHETLAGLSLDAANELRERLEEDPDKVTNGQLLEMIKVGADRTGFGPKTESTLNVNVGLAERMQEARERAERRRREIDITPQSE